MADRAALKPKGTRTLYLKGPPTVTIGHAIISIVIAFVVGAIVSFVFQGKENALEQDVKNEAAKLGKKL